ncbi:MAG: preprotein translocase subunit YajC [Actinomycetaceae bacterium]|nr:preprotein translocase subunit YajC [Actinomycetaceae bacterium]
MDLFSMLMIVIAMFALFYFMNKNQRRRQEQAQEMIRTMEPGNWVITSTGFYGRLVDIDGDVAILETADGTETYWARQMVLRAQEPPFAVDEDNAMDATESEHCDDDALTNSADDLPSSRDESSAGSSSTSS